MSQRSPGARGRPTTAPTEVSARTPRPLSRPAPPPASCPRMSHLPSLRSRPAPPSAGGRPRSPAPGRVRPRLPLADVIAPPVLVSRPASLACLPRKSRLPGPWSLPAPPPARGHARGRPPPPLVCPPRRSGGFPPARLSHYQRVGKGWCRFPAVPVTRRGRESEESRGVAGGVIQIRRPCTQGQHS